MHDSDYYQPQAFVSETEFNVELCDIARASENTRTVIFPRTVRNVLDGTFRHTHLRSVILSKGLKIIKPRCFHNSEIERIVIPKGVEEIQENAFYCCKNLKKVLLEEGSQLKVIGREVFMGCSGLTDIFLPDGLTEIGLRAFRESGLESVETPSSVRIIHQSAFCKCQNLKKAALNEGLEALGADEYPDDGGKWYGVFQESALESV